MGCRATLPTQNAGYRHYHEDLKVHRDRFLPDPEEIPLHENASEPKTLTGHITPQINTINEMIISRNRQQAFADGYRLQVYYGMDREKAEEIRDRIKQEHPSLPRRLTYYQPNYQVHAGRFYDLLEAERWQKMILKSFAHTIIVESSLKLSAGE